MPAVDELAAGIKRASTSGQGRQAGRVTVNPNKSVELYFAPVAPKVEVTAEHSVCVFRQK